MTASNALCLAEVGIGALRLGVPVDAVVEAIALPAAPGQLPRRRGALAGVVEHGGRLVPVVDLARWVDVGTAAHAGAGADMHAGAGARVLVLREAGRTVGLKVDAVGGLVEVQRADLMRLHHDDDPEEVFHSAARAPEGGQVLSLLDAGRLARLAAAWSEDPAAAQDGAVPAHADNAGHAQAAATRLYALLQVGVQQLAVPAEALSEVVPMPALARFGGGIDSAWCRWRGRHLPILQSGALLAQAGAEAAPLLAVIERAGLALGLPVQAALRLDSFGGGALPAAGGLVATAYDRDGQPVQLLDDAALFARFPEAALSRGGDAADDRGAVHGGQAARDAGNACAFIVYEADGLAAVPIDAIERILGPAEAAAVLNDADGACIEWSGRAIPLRELRAPAHVQAPQLPHLLLVRGANGLHACAVARVHLLIPPGGGQVYRIGKTIEFITAGEGAAQASYRIVDLAAIG
jgi:chemotaxis signal transduction protein